MRRAARENGSLTVTEHMHREAVERGVLDSVERLLAEVRGADRGVAVRLDDSLERDLALGSLERVELLLRVERTFGVHLPDAALADAQTPGDLVSAVLAGGAAGPVGLERLPGLPAGVPAPASARTLIDVLQWHVRTHPDRAHIFLRDDDGHERASSYADLLAGAGACAAGLCQRGICRGESVALMLRTEEAFFHAFFGTLLAGGVPVPLYPPFRADRLEEYARRQAAILRSADARILVTFGQAERLAGLLRGYAPGLQEVALAERLGMPGADVPAVPHGPGDPALIQYTSGSTGEPKGVLLSHANLLANIRAIGDGIRIQPDEVCVSWLPLYHDMGLIGAWLASLYFGAPAVLMSPLAFLSRPARWLWAIHAHRGTVSPAPNFAYDLCARRIPDDQIEGLDLSSWRLALNGSEPVSPDTIERFTRRFAPYGFRPEAMSPVYGLAECAVGLTMPPAGRPPRIDRVARQPFVDRGLAAPAGPADASALRFVSCGRPLRDHDVRVVGVDGRATGERQQGRVEFRGPSVTAGYFRNAGATQAVLRNGWMDSGDLGYLAEGELFITSRQKDLVILGGRNVYPQEVEETAGDVPGVRKGCVAAFGVHDPAIGTERLVIVAETRETGRARAEALQAAIADRVAAAIGIPPDRVVVGGPGAVLKTSSGKIRRSATRDAYLRGELGRRPRSTGAQLARLSLGYAAGWLRRLGREAGRALYTAYVAALLLLAVPALWVPLLATRYGRASDRLVKAWSRLVIALSGVTLRASGIEHLRAAGPAVLVCNHASFIDVIVLMAAIPTDFRFVAKRTLGAYPLIGTAIRKASHVTVERSGISGRLAGLDAITNRLRAGESLLIFPEGTFRRAPGILPFRLGAFRAAAETGRPIVPIALRGTRHVLPEGSWLLRRGRIDVTIGRPVGAGEGSWREMVRLRDAVQAQIAECAREPALSG